MKTDSDYQVLADSVPGKPFAYTTSAPLAYKRATEWLKELVRDQPTNTENRIEIWHDGAIIASMTAERYN